MSSAAVAHCARCAKTLLLLPYRKHGTWQQAVVCPKCDSVHMMPRGKEPPPDETSHAAAA